MLGQYAATWLPAELTVEQIVPKNLHNQRSESCDS